VLEYDKWLPLGVLLSVGSAVFWFGIVQHPGTRIGVARPAHATTSHIGTPQSETWVAAHRSSSDALFAISNRPHAAEREDQSAQGLEAHVNTPWEELLSALPRKAPKQRDTLGETPDQLSSTGEKGRSPEIAPSNVSAISEVDTQPTTTRARSKIPSLPRQETVTQRAREKSSGPHVASRAQPHQKRAALNATPSGESNAARRRADRLRTRAHVRLTGKREHQRPLDTNARVTGPEAPTTPALQLPQALTPSYLRNPS
jgi:hypothetical protein